VHIFELLDLLALCEDDGWAEKRIPCGNGRQKGNGKGGLAFVISHPSRKVRGEDGAPSLVVRLKESKGIVGHWALRKPRSREIEQERDLGHPRFLFIQICATRLLNRLRRDREEGHSKSTSDSSCVLLLLPGTVQHPNAATGSLCRLRFPDR
jgi:hypothetical protein